MNAPSPTVYIVDDDNELRASLVWLLETVSVQAESFASAKEFLAAYDPDRPACLVLDVRMPETGGFQLQQMLNNQGATLPIIFVSAHGDIPMSVKALQNGAIDFVEKPYNPQQMLERIQGALQQAIQLHDSEEQRKKIRAKLNKLTEREREILCRVLDGKASKVIADELHISVKTVDVHRTKIREKLGVVSTATLVREVMEVWQKAPTGNWT